MKKIYWETCKKELICETEEGKKNVNIVGVQVGKGNYPVPIITLNKTDLKKIITSKKDYHSLVIPKAFMHEGMNEFHSLRYINAFYNFYFVIEGLYGNGKTQNKAVEKELKKSIIFQEFIKWTIENIKVNARHFKNINQMLKIRSKTLDVDGIIDLIVRTRGGATSF